MILPESDAFEYRIKLKRMKLTIEEAAEQMDISKNTLVNALKSRSLRFHKLKIIVEFFGDELSEEVTIIDKNKS